MDAQTTARFDGRGLRKLPAR